MYNLLHKILCNKLYISLPTYRCVRQVYTHSNLFIVNTTGMTKLMIQSILFAIDIHS